MNAQLDVKTFLVLKDLPRILKGRLIDEFIQKSQTQTFNWPEFLMFRKSWVDSYCFSWSQPEFFRRITDSFLKFEFLLILKERRHKWFIDVSSIFSSSNLNVILFTIHHQMLKSMRKLCVGYSLTSRKLYSYYWEYCYIFLGLFLRIFWENSWKSVCNTNLS